MTTPGRSVTDISSLRKAGIRPTFWVTWSKKALWSVLPSVKFGTDFQHCLELNGSNFPIQQIKEKQLTRKKLLESVNRMHLEEVKGDSAMLLLPNLLNSPPTTQGALFSISWKLCCWNSVAAPLLRRCTCSQAHESCISDWLLHVESNTHSHDFQDPGWRHFSCLLPSSSRNTEWMWTLYKLVMFCYTWRNLGPKSTYKMAVQNQKEPFNWMNN